MNRISDVVPVPQGSSLPPRLYNLAAQRVPIRTISINNSSTLTVFVYFGSSARGIPITILPKKTMAIAMEGTSSTYIAFAGTATTDGFVYLSFTDKEAGLFTAEGLT